MVHATQILLLDSYDTKKEDRLHNHVVGTTNVMVSRHLPSFRVVLVGNYTRDPSYCAIYYLHNPRSKVMGLRRAWP